MNNTPVTIKDQEALLLTSSVLFLDRFSRGCLLDFWRSEIGILNRTQDWREHLLCHFLW